MKTWDLSRCALATGVAAVLLAACGGSQPPIGAPGAMAQNTASHGSKTFNYSGSEQHFKVPRRNRAYRYCERRKRPVWRNR
jgi:hypothetical protein